MFDTRILSGPETWHCQFLLNTSTYSCARKHSPVRGFVCIELCIYGTRDQTSLIESRHRDGKAPDWIMRWQIQIYQKSSDLSCLGWISISWVTEFFVNLSSESSQSKCSNFFLSKIIILLASSQIWPPGTFLSRSSNFTSSLKGNWEFCDPKSYNSRLKVTWERKVILV